MRLYLCILLITSQLAIAQKSISISGYVRDATSNEALLGVTVQISNPKLALQTNNYGYYAFMLAPGTYTIQFSSIGYKPRTKTITVDAPQALDIQLQPDDNVLEEVVVSQEKPQEKVKSLEMSVNKVSMKTIRKIPAFLGEVDVIRSIQNLPGVSTVGEGASGFNVRGGNIDQNLVLLDEAPIYNSSHLFGFFSVFNPDVVRDIKLYKGGVPAEYGGRVSSILDVRLKEGNQRKTQVNGGIGTIFSRISYERPITVDKGSFILAARRSYIDILAKPLLPSNLRGSSFYFYDLTAKANYQINPSNTLFVSGYLGRDVFGADFGFNWGSNTASVRWNRIISPKLFMNITGFYSRYDYSLDTDRNNKSPREKFRWGSAIDNISMKADFTYYPSPKHTLSYGGNILYYLFEPGKATATSEGVDRPITVPAKYAAEQALYISNQHQISNRFSVLYGIRYSFYQQFGKGTNYLLERDTRTQPVQRRVISQENFVMGQVMSNYQNLEPRLALNWLIRPTNAIKLSYNRMAQYVHLLSNTTASSPLDVWTPSTNNIPPQLVHQVALGNFWHNQANTLEASVEIYYKDLANQIDYIRNADLLLNPRVEADLLFGIGRAYGAEWYVKKSTGKLNGWVSYTLARTERKIPGLNNGNWFPSRIDRLHNLSVVGIYEFSKRWTGSANFIYLSGTPASFPTNKFIWQGIALPHNETDARNTYRIPASHRLDISFTRQNKYALFKKGSSEWVFSVYNVYNRRNPFSVFVRQQEQDFAKTEAVRYAVFGSVVPAITYNFKF